MDWFLSEYHGRFRSLPELDDRGRNLRGGYARGVGLEFHGGVRRLYEEDTLFRKAREMVGQTTITTDPKLANIYLIMKYFFPMMPPGDIVEFGSYKGGSAAFMGYIAAALYPGMQIFALDTFTGMPSTDPAVDLHRSGDFADNGLTSVKEFLERCKLKNVVPVPGLFEDTAANTLTKIKNIRLCHIDCDIHSACVTAYESSKPFMVKGGYYVFDDPTFSTCIGAFQMIEDYLVRRDGLSAEQVYPHFVFRYPAPR